MFATMSELHYGRANRAPVHGTVEADLLTISRIDPTLPDKTAYLVPFKWWSMVIGTKNCEISKIGDLLSS